MLGLAGVVALQALVDELVGGARRIRALGDPRHVAGSPEDIGALARAHVEASRVLDATRISGQERAQRLIAAGDWEGPASRAFFDYWMRIQGQMEDLSSRHEKLANSLTEVAEEASRLNARVVAQIGAVDRWVSSARDALLHADLVQIELLVQTGEPLASEWQRIFGDLERHADWSRERLVVDLTLSTSVTSHGGRPTGLLNPPVIVLPKGPDGYQHVEDLGPVSSLNPDFRTPQQVMEYFQEHPQQIFPFGLRGAPPIRNGELIDLAVPTEGSHSRVKVTSETPTSFTFTTLPGHFDPPGSTITFTVYRSNGHMYLKQTAHWAFTSFTQMPVSYASAYFAPRVWDEMGGNLRQAIVA